MRASVFWLKFCSPFVGGNFTCYFGASYQFDFNICRRSVCNRKVVFWPKISCINAYVVRVVCVFSVSLSHPQDIENILKLLTRRALKRRVCW